MQKQRKEQREDKSSILLTLEENRFLFSLLGPRCQSMSTAVIQLFTSEPPAFSRWDKQFSGIACFVKDNIQRSYFIRVYCMIEHQLIWEEKMTRSMQVYYARDFFIGFQGQNHMVALNFADEYEANNFYDTMLSKIIRSTKQEQRIQTSNNCENMSGTQRSQQPMQQQQIQQLKRQQQQPLQISPANKKTNHKRQITKEDISQPYNFSQIAHVGFGEPFSLDTVNAWDKYVKKQQPSSDLRQAPTPPKLPTGGSSIPATSVISSPRIPSSVTNSMASLSAAPPPPPPPPPVPSGFPSSSSMNQTLVNQNQIRSDDYSRAPALFSDPRSDLLNQIQQGTALRQINKPSTASQPPAKQMDSFYTTMAHRFQSIQISDDENSDDSSNWE